MKEREVTQLQRELIAQVKDSSLRQVDLARRTGYTQKHISMVLNGHVEGTLTMWQAMLDAIQDNRDISIYRCDGCGKRVRRDGNEPTISSYCDTLGETRVLVRERYSDETEATKLCPDCRHPWGEHDTLLKGAGKGMLREYNPYGVEDLYECNAYMGMGNWCGCTNRSRTKFDNYNGRKVPLP